MQILSTNERTLRDWQSEFKRLEGAFADRTIRSYLTDVAIFVDWCANADRQALPVFIATEI